VTVRRRQSEAGPPSAGDRWVALILCLLTVVLWGAASAGPVAWAAPGHSPPGQTVPTVTPAPDQPSPPASDNHEQEFSPAPTETPTSLPPTVTTIATPTATAAARTEAATTATPTSTSPPITVTAIRQPSPTSFQQTAQSSFVALSPPVLPAPRVCAPSVVAAPTTTLSVIYDQPTPVGLAWLVFLGTGILLITIGIVLIFGSSG
jgi:hypothetical protein